MKLTSVGSLIGAAAFAALIPAAASAQNYGYGYSYGSQNRHEDQHEHLQDRHDGNHDQLAGEHEEAHEQGLSPWGHTQLHRDLAEQHAYADYGLARRHQREHRRSGWRPRYRNSGYNNYYGY